MKLGAEPKKIAILGGLLVVAGAVFYFNVFSGGPEPAPRVSVGPAPAVPAPSSQRTQTERRRAPGTGVIGDSFKPRQGYPRPEDKPDPATIDPTVHLDLLAKLQNIQPEATSRNIFQYGKAEPPASAKPPELPKNVQKIATNQPPSPPQPPGPPPPPQAPPMTFKYYGYKITKSDGRKVAFLLDGDDIILASENEAMKAGRYKVVRIGVNSITIEDTQFKSEQTLRLQEDLAA